MSGFLALAIAAIVLGLVNAAVRPILLILTLPITILTLGLFYFVVNGLAFGFAVAVVFNALAIAGSFLDRLVGFSFGSLVDPIQTLAKESIEGVVDCPKPL